MSDFEPELGFEECWSNTRKERSVRSTMAGSFSTDQTEVDGQGDKARQGFEDAGLDVSATVYFLGMAKRKATSSQRGSAPLIIVPEKRNGSGGPARIEACAHTTRQNHAVPPVVVRCDITDNEVAWIEFLRVLSGGDSPATSLAGVQALRCASAVHNG